MTIKKDAKFKQSQNLRLLKVVLTNECSRGAISLSRGRIDEWDVRPPSGDKFPSGETEESDISSCDR